jgi:hypothetical protein
MKKNITYILCLTCGLILMFLLVTVYNSFVSKKMPLNELCRGYLVYNSRASNNPFFYKLEHSVFFSKNGHGYDSMKGAFEVNDSKYVISRTINFTYKEMSSERIRLEINSINISSQDTLPEMISRRYLSFYEKDTVNYIRTDRINHHRVMVVGSMGDIFVCSYK